jgi:glycosyltransferase involved in cell wall biosynthesis
MNEPNQQKNRGITIIMPAYNEEQVIGGVIEKLKALDLEADILVVDDCSSDNTKEVAEKAGARVIRHPYNKGNGAAIKTGIRNARGEIIVTMDADGQHNPDDVPRLLRDIGDFDMVVGARSDSSEGKLHRNIANRIYNGLASYLCTFKVEDLTSGFRAVKTKVARKFIYLFPNRFSYPTTITMSLIKSGFNVKYEPIKASERVGKSKIRLFQDGAKFFIIIFKIATLFRPIKIFLPVSIVLFLLGIGWYAVTFISEHRFTNMSLLLMVASVNIFLLGLLAEQVAELRYDKTDE